MPIDPRIALSIVSPTYDFMGAYNTSRAAARTDLTNQMAQQAAQATAELNRNAMTAAQTLDPTNQGAMRAFAQRYGAAGAPVIEGLAGVDTMFSNRATAARDETKAATEQSEAHMAQLPQFAAQLLGDASPPTVARVRAQWEGSGFPVGVFDALAARLADLPPEQQQQAIQSYLLTTGGGKTAVETRFGPRTLVNTGATQEARNLNPLALDPATGAPVPVTGPIQNTADPRAPQIIQTTQGIGQLGADGTFTPATDAEGNPLMPYVPPRAGEGGDEPARAAAAATLTDVLYQLDENFETLYQAGFMRGEGVSDIGNVAQYVRDKVPFLRGIQLAGNPAADAASGRVEALLSTAVSTLSSLYGTSSRVMDAVKEMENIRKSFGSQDIPIEAVRSMIRTVFQRVAEEEFARTGTRPAPPPERGAVRDGYRYRGGNPANETSWTPVR